MTMTSAKKSSRPPALTPEQREQRLISLAYDVAEQQLMDGTASPSVITHYLKLGTIREGLERDRLRSENEMLRAKATALESAQRTEERYAEILQAFKSYAGGLNDTDVF